MYYIYIIRCIDNSLYTGITTDIERRFKEHKNKLSRGAKYTKNHDVLNIECYYLCGSKVLASKLEYYIKHLKKKEKESLIINNNLKELLGTKIDYYKYLRVK